jgi:hypothetical protein
LSGERGVAVIHQGDEWSVIHEPDYTRSAKSGLSSAIRLDGARDVVEFESSDPTAIEHELARCRAQDAALQYVLVLFEEDQIGQLEARMLESLKKLMLYQGVPEFVERRLYASPLPANARKRAEAVRDLDWQHPVSRMLSRVLDRQKRIREVREAWESVSAGWFRSVQERDEYFSSAVQAGLVQRLVEDPEGVLRDGSAIIGDRTLLYDWAAISEKRLLDSDCRMEKLAG